MYIAIRHIGSVLPIQKKEKYKISTTLNIDFGKEAARQLALKRIRPYLCCPISISDYREDYCGNCHHLKVTAVNIDGKVAESLLNDPSTTPGVIVESIDAIAQDVEEIYHEPEKIITKPAKEIKRAVKKVNKVIKKIF